MRALSPCSAAAGWLTLAVVAAACAPAPAGQGGGDVRPAAAPKRIVAAMMSDPPAISSRFIAAGSGTIPGGDSLEELVNAGLTITDNEGRLHPQLAESAPTIENGLWKLLPDGRMETTWRIKPQLQWHDGAPFTSADVAFSFTVSRDRELPVFRDAALTFTESIDTPDPFTVTLHWRQPYIQADAMFTRRSAFPRPRHILETTYTEDKLAFTQQPYWTQDYVGTGPFRVRDWVQGSHLLLSAYDRYVLGRPNIDEIEVRFIPDQNTLSANLLAGAIDITLGRSLSLDQALQVRDAWPEGRADIGFKNWIAIYPQFLNPNPPVVLEVQFRRALMHAIDRQQLADSLQSGLVPVAHGFLSPKDPLHAQVEASIVRYDYDPSRAGRLLEGLGYRRDGEGVRDAAGQRLALELFDGLSEDLGDKALLGVADFWQRIGVATTPVFIPGQRRADREYGATFPAFRIIRQPNDPLSVERYHSRNTPLAENRFSGGNRSRYSNPEFDNLVDRYTSTIPLSERTQLLAQIIHHITDQLVIMGLFYNTEPVLVSNRLQGITSRLVGPTTEAWNAHQWDIKS